MKQYEKDFIKKIINVNNIPPYLVKLSYIRKIETFSYEMKDISN